MPTFTVSALFQALAMSAVTATPAAPPPSAAPPAPAAAAPAAPIPPTDAAEESVLEPETAEPEPEPETAEVTAATDDPPALTVAPAPVLPAAPPPILDVPINIGLFPSVSINGSHRGRRVNNSVSAAVGWSRAAKLDGVAVAGVATVVDEEARGLTWSMAANLAHGAHYGLQATHGYNYAKTLRGVQAGAVNNARDATGAQFGLVNVAGKVRGVQVGLINYAEEADASFALLPITKKGGVRAEVWTSDTALLNVGIRLPANYTYAFIAGGLHPMGHRAPAADPIPRTAGAPVRDRGRAMQIGAGFGGHLPVLQRGCLDADIAVYGVTSGLDLAPPFANLVKLRLMGGWQAAKHLSIFGGPTLNAMFDAASNPVARPGYGWVAKRYTEAGVRIRLWPGFVAGLRF